MWSSAAHDDQKAFQHFYIPSTMVHDAIAVPVMVRKRFMARIGTGIRKLQNTMIQKSGANCWRMLVQKTAISEGVLPYQVVIRSPKVKVTREQAHGQQQFAEVVEIGIPLDIPPDAGTSAAAPSPALPAQQCR